MYIALKETNEELRRKIKQILSVKSSRPWQVSDVCQRLAEPHRIPGSGHTPDVNPGDRDRVQDIIWDLIIEGYLRPGGGNGVNTEMPFFHVTAKGEEYFAKP